MRKLKVYGGFLPTREGQRRHIMASTSWAKVALASKSSVSHLMRYWSITGNEEEIKLATSRPEVLINTGGD